MGVMFNIKQKCEKVYRVLMGLRRNLTVALESIPVPDNAMTSPRPKRELRYSL